MTLVVASGNRSKVKTASNIVFFDDFSGSSVDSSKWEVYDRDGDRANSELNVVRPANAVVSGGKLAIVSEYDLDAFSGYDAEDETFETRSYATAQIATKQTFLYGIFEARIKADPATGTWPLFWMLGHAWQASQPTTANVAGHDWPDMAGGWWEIDIMEFLGGTRTSNNCAAHVNTSNADEVALGVSASSQFITYRLEWRADKLEWSVDTAGAGTFSVLKTITDTNYIPTNPGYLICHTAIGGAGGAPDSGDYPSQSEYDYVRVLQ